MKTLHHIEKICARLQTWPVSWFLGAGVGGMIAWLCADEKIATILTPTGRWVFGISWAIGMGGVVSNMDLPARWNPEATMPKSRTRRWIEAISIGIVFVGGPGAFCFFDQAPRQ